MPEVESSAPHQPNAVASLHQWKPLFRWAGVASVPFVVLLITALILDFLAPPPVHGGAEILEFIATNKVNYIAEQILWILPNILPVLVFAALFVALAPHSKKPRLDCPHLWCPAVGAYPGNPRQQPRIA